MRKSLLGPAVAILCVMASSAIPARSEAPNLVGSWRLVSYEERTTSGAVIPVWGNSPRGRLMYDAGGRMSVQLMNPQRRTFASPDRLGGTADEVRGAFEGYLAYYGTYSVDPSAGVVTHHVDGALYPNHMGTDLRRSFQLSGKRLRLSTPPTLSGGRTSTFDLVWEREE